MTPPRAADRAVLSAVDRAWQMGLTKEEGEVAFLAAKHCDGKGPKPDAIIKRTRAHWKRQIQLLQLVWRIHESGGEGVMAVTEATERLRAAIREHLEEQPHATARETRKALQDAGIDTGGTSSFDGYHVPAVRKELGIDTKRVQARAARVREAGRRKMNGAAPGATAGSDNPRGKEEHPPEEEEHSSEGAASEPENMHENITGPENLNGGVKKSAPESDDDFDAAAHAREIVAKGAQHTGTLEDRSREIFYGTGRPDLAAAARHLLDQVEEECLGSHGGWVSWYGQGPDEVLRVLRLRVALGMEIPADFAPLLALGREAA